MAYDKKNTKAIKRFQIIIDKNYMNGLTLRFEHMYKSCIYANILSFLDIPDK